MAGVLVISGMLLFLFVSCAGCAKDGAGGGQESRVESLETSVESQESRVERQESSVEGPREAIVPVVGKEESRGESLETVGATEARNHGETETWSLGAESPRAAEERIVLRGTQESTETVAKIYGDFSENDAFLKGQKLSSQSSTGAGATAEEGFMVHGEGLMVNASQGSDERQSRADLADGTMEVRNHGTTEVRNHETTEVQNRGEEETEAVPLSSDTEEPVVEKILPPVLTDERPGVEENVADNAPSQPSDLNPQTSVRKPYLALRTNLLYDAVVVPNIGLEVAVGAGFTIGADWFYTWIPLDKPHFYWQTYGGYLTLRYYIGKQAKENPYTGHHVGLYGSMLTYDVEFGGIGYQAAQFGFGGGVEYGYSLPVARSLCIDFNLGLGYQGGEYKKYMPTDDGTGHYVWMSTHRRHWFGPTKAEISLKWLIGPYEKKSSAAEEKGGGL